MRCLWLTLIDPEPRHNGQLVYSGGLIGGAAEAGMETHVVGLGRQSRPRPLGSGSDNKVWWLADGQLRSRLISLASPLPHMASRAKSPKLHRLLRDRLNEEWDAIVFDGISAGWALDMVLRRYQGEAQRPRVVYVSHNHERSLREEVAKNHPFAPLRMALQYDTMKVAALERRLVAAADLVTAITPEDRDRYLQDQANLQIAVLTPGYDGKRLEQRSITKDLPRRAVIVGSFEWIAKQLNLSEFIAIADPLFAAAGAQLQIVGHGNPDFIKRMRRDALATEFTGRVRDVSTYMEQARVALVPERHGGGFKLKVLDYVFGRMPILAIDGSVAGMPLNHGESILYFRDPLALARGVLRVIDDFDQLNGLQERAFAQCHDSFSWRQRGETLRALVQAA
jgi:glycosyltransferase involved in cell wall biosynthesis